MIAAIQDDATGDDVVDETVATTVDDESSAAADESVPITDGDRTGKVESKTLGRSGRRARRWYRILAYAVLPGLSLIIASGAGYLKWQGDTAREVAAAQTQSVAAAKDSAIAMLSYRADTAENQLMAARDRLTGAFRDAYSALIQNVVIPGAKQKHISAVATVPAVAAVSANPNHAVVLVFVDQSITVGADTPTSTASSVKVTLDKVGEQWLISDFTPV